MNNSREKEASTRECVAANGKNGARRKTTASLRNAVAVPGAEVGGGGGVVGGGFKQVATATPSATSTAAPSPGTPPVAALPGHRMQPTIPQSTGGSDMDLPAVQPMDWLFKKERIYLLAQFWQQVSVEFLPRSLDQLTHEPQLRHASSVYPL
ncbi:hypothetical protein ZHAS_00011420 [Anopheles sinensis]|uniref:Uncharacterized protein n=1 Tax=Anopheles sinensis TaxID=74873 RepID=A0A084W0E6_ANOSI|nr:hypothetical protein ZHAS_00011420 [Anopheles sinensis]